MLETVNLEKIREHLLLHTRTSKIRQGTRVYFSQTPIVSLGSGATSEHAKKGTPYLSW